MLQISVTLALALAPAVAQTSATWIERTRQPWRWVRFGEEDGLAAARILDLADLGESVWAATDEGLFRYDGWTWRAIGPEQGVPRAAIQSLSADASGEIWLVAQGLLLRGDESGFVPVPMPGELAATSPHQVVVESDGEILLVVREGLAGRLRLARGDEHTLALTALPEDWPGAKRLSIARTASGRVWLASDFGLRVLEDGAWSPWIDRPDRSVQWLQVVDETASGHGICGLRTTSGATHTWTWSRGGIPVPVDDRGACLVQASALGHDGTGVLLLESRECLLVRGGAWSEFHPAPEALRAADLLRFRPNGDLWVATKGGLQLCRLSSERLTQWREPGVGSAFNRVEEILLAGDGTVWIATYGGVVAWRADGSRLDVPALDVEPYPQLTGIAEDAAGRIWVSSGARRIGLACWDGERWKHVERDADGRLLGLIHKIRPAKDGSLWCLTLTDDPEASEAELGSVQRIVGDTVSRWTAADELTDRRFYDVAETPDGAVWFGTTRGIARRHADEWSSLGQTEGLRHDRVFRLAATRSGEIVFHNTMEGPGRVATDGTITYVPGELPDELRTYVADLALDAQERLWLSAHGGLFVHRDGHWSSIDFDPGSSNPRMWPVLAGTDRMYAGTADGLFLLSLDEMDDAPPRVEFEPPTIDGDRALLRWSARAAWQGTSASWLETRHRLDQGEWSSWGRTREIDLAGLAPGSHALEVQAKGLFGRVDERGRIAFETPLPLVLRRSFYLPIAGLSLALLGLASFALRRRRRDAIRLRKSEAEHRRLMEQASDAILICDEHGRVALANSRADELAGVERRALLGAPLAQLFATATPSSRSDRYADLAPGESLVEELELRRENGATLIVEASVKRLVDGRLQAILRDLTERRRQERERRAWERRVNDAQRLQSLGLLAGGIAHDFNNLLMVIQGSSEELGADGSGQGALERLRGAVRRASSLTQQLLVYAGRGALQMVETDLRALVLELAECLEASLPPGVYLRTALPDEHLPVRVDAARIGQLLYHLVLNSAEAFGQRGGTIEIETGRACTGDETLSVEQWRAIPVDGSWVVLRVRDDGTGIPSEILERIFDPFYSTRGEGRGMGLAVVRGIVLSHRGHVRVESAPERGSVFTVLLPWATRTSADERASTGPAAWSGRGAVLVVDDEDGVREVTARMLERRGYRVIEARDGREALGRLEEDPGDIACALLDLTMPGWNGIETMRALRERKPELPVLLVSGFSALDLESALPGGTETSLLHKPFTLQELEEHMRVLLQPEPDLQ